MKIDGKSLLKYGYARFSCESRFQSTVGIAHSIGDVLELPEISMVQTLRPNGAKEIEASSYSGNYGVGEFPLHTDMAHWYIPPPYLLLRCIQPAEDVFTTVASVKKVIDAEMSETYKRALFRPRRRLDGRLSVLRLYDRGIFRWDQLFIQPMNFLATELQAKVADRVKNLSANSVCYESATDCILVDNWGAIHGRSSVPELALNRVLERVFLSKING